MRKEENIILNMKEKENAGIGRILRRIKKLKELHNIGDFALYSRVIIALSKNGIKIPHHQIIRHFKLINKEEYSQDEKRELLGYLKTINETEFRLKQPKESHKTHQKSTTFNVYASVDTLYPIGKKTVIN